MGYVAQVNIDLSTTNNYNSNTTFKITTPIIKDRVAMKPKTPKTKTKHPKGNGGGSKKSDNSQKALRVGSSVALSTAIITNSSVGHYTGNKVRQTNIQSGIAIATTLIGALKNPTLALISMGTYAITRTVSMSIEKKNSEQESAYKRSYLGNMTTSGSRWRGGQ